MDTWILWIIAAAVLLVAEATTTAFVAIYFGVGAGIAAIAAALGAPLFVQILVFGRASIAGIALTRPALSRASRSTPILRTGVDSMRGRRGVVTKAIADLEPGQIRVDGDIWQARSYFDGEPIAVGTRIEIVEVKGVTAMVMPTHHDEIEGAAQ
jgi:membrane protein implicated in regulation of membrane protease activity